MSINVQQYWKTKIYISQDAHVWVVHGRVQHSRSRHCWHRKEVLHISNLLFCTVQFNVMEEGPVIPQETTDVEFLGGLHFLLRILHSKKPWRQKSGRGKSSPLADKQEFVLHHEESTKTLLLFREEGRQSGRSWSRKGPVGGIYMKAVVVNQRELSQASLRTCVLSTNR